jgi:hypothetical protein
MARRKSKPETKLTAEQLKALIDAQDWVVQTRLYQLFVEDRNSVIGRAILSMLAYHHVRIDRLEVEAGLGLGDIDPEELLSRKESLKEAKRRLGKTSTGAVKAARHRAKERQAKLKRTMPSVSTQGGQILKVTERA